MSHCRLVILVAALVLVLSPPAVQAQSFAPVGNLDCNGYSQIQQPLKTQLVCADFIGGYDQSGYDNGHYIGHDEPSIGFISTAPHSGNNIQWEFTLPREGGCRRRSPLRIFSLSGSLWRCAIPIRFPGEHASLTAIKTTPTLPGLRSSSCNSIHPAFPPSSLRSVAI